MENNNCQSNNRMTNMSRNYAYRGINTRPASSGYDTMPYRPKDNFVVGMAYVPWQTWGNVYDPCKGLSRGTIFPELDKPFEGGCCR